MRASRLTKHRISRVWGRSLLCRSLGLAPACTVTGSVSARALPSPCAAWGRLITALRPLGGLRKLRSNRERSCCIRFGLLGQPSLCFTARAACARPKTRRVLRQTTDRRISSWGHKHSSSSNQISSRSKPIIMPLIELARRGKDVSLSLTLPEETANDVKLYARFLKATHQSAVSNIISEWFVEP